MNEGSFKGLASNMRDKDPIYHCVHLRYFQQIDRRRKSSGVPPDSKDILNCSGRRTFISFLAKIHIAMGIICDERLQFSQNQGRFFPCRLNNIYNFFPVGNNPRYFAVPSVMNDYGSLTTVLESRLLNIMCHTFHCSK